MQNKKQQWLDSLPLLIEKISRQWNLINLEPLPQGWAGNAVFSGKQRQVRTSGAITLCPIVLKICYDQQAAFQEINALRFYHGTGFVKLLDVDKQHDAFLLEHIIPGTMLKSLFPQQDKIALIQTVHVMQKLHAVPLNSATQNFPTIAQWLTSLQTDWPSLQHHFPKARKLANKLLATQAAPVLLHGDLHHENIILRDTDEWVAIDPKGVIGEPAYEVGAYIRNPMPELLQQQNITNIIGQRLDLFANLLDLSRQRLKEWSYVQEVLADCWALEDGANPDQLTDLASIIDAA